MERISQFVLIVVGALVLVVLTLALAVSCRQQPSDAAATTTPGTPLSTIPPTWTPLSAAELTGTATAAAPIPAGETATATPTPPGAPAGSPTATPTPFGATPAAPPPDAATATGPTSAPSPATPPEASPPAEGGVPPVAPVPQPAPGPAATPVTYVPGTTVRHTVNRGEWLIQIARCYGAPYTGVHAANALPNPDYILPGQIITVPNIGTAGRIIGPPCVQAYFVQAGDTWESLATRFGTTTAILQRANPGALSVGRAIWAPRN